MEIYQKDVRQGEAASGRRLQFKCGQLRDRAAAVPSFMLGAAQLSSTGNRHGFYSPLFPFRNFPELSQSKATNFLQRMTIARMKVTRQFIMDNRTLRGSWTQAQIEALGIVWPPRAGWIDGVIGHELTEAQVRQFQNKATKKQVKAGNAGQFDLF